MCNNIKWLIFSIWLSCRCVQVYYRQEEKKLYRFYNKDMEGRFIDGLD